MISLDLTGMEGVIFSSNKQYQTPPSLFIAVGFSQPSRSKVLLGFSPRIAATKQQSYSAI